MLTKSSMLMKISNFLKNLAPTLAIRNSLIFVGEPKLPEKLKEMK